MKAKGLLLKSYGKDGGIFPKMFFDETTKKLTVIEKDGSEYFVPLLKTTDSGIETVSFNLSAPPLVHTQVFNHNLGAIPTGFEYTITTNAGNLSTIVFNSVTYDATTVTFRVDVSGENTDLCTFDINWKVIA